MKKDDLCVFFHAAARGDNREILQAFENAVLAASPSAISLSATKPSEALSFMQKKSEGRPIALVTLCDEMMAAATGSDIAIVSLGVPARLGDRHYIAASFDSIGDMLRDIKRSIQ